MVSTTSQINKVVEFIAVLGRFDYSELVFVLSPFLLGRSICVFTFFLQSFMDDDFVKSLLFGMLGVPG